MTIDAKVKMKSSRHLERLGEAIEKDFTERVVFDLYGEDAKKYRKILKICGNNGYSSQEVMTEIYRMRTYVIEETLRKKYSVMLDKPLPGTH